MKLLFEKFPYFTELQTGKTILISVIQSLLMFKDFNGDFNDIRITYYLPRLFD